MVDTTRIRSQFDVEMQLGRGWLFRALATLAAEGLLFTPPPPFPPDAEVGIVDVEIIFEPADWDLRIDLTIAALPMRVLARVALAADGTELEVTNDQTPEVTRIPFDVFQGLAAPPVLVKLRGNDDHEPCLALLANLDIQAGPQSEEPRPDGDPLPRGEPLLALSFLPTGVDVAVGIGLATFPRFANDVWHTQLRADDGTHPLPDAADPIGTWHVVSAAAQPGRIRLTLVGEVPIDIWPDATITIDINLTPEIVDGAVTFTIGVDTDVDTGLLGDLFGGIVLGLVGLVLGAVTGGSLLVFAAAGFAAGVVAVELAETVVEGVVRRRILASLDGTPVQPLLSCQDSVVVEAIPPQGDRGIALGVVDAVPRSVTIATTRPDAVHNRYVQVVTDVDTLTIDGNGFAFTGSARADEAFEPVPAALVEAARVPAGGELSGLVYRATDGETVELPVPEAIERAAADAFGEPLRIAPVPAGAETSRGGGRLPVVCLSPTAVRRAETIVTDFRFSTGLVLSVPEAVLLQDAGALVLPGLQLIHPDGASPYFRSPPDSTTDNNVESLPEF
jgi:hypothetical protein